MGTFDGLPDNAVFAASNSSLRIRYDGGTGNDVTLTVLLPCAAGDANNDGQVSVADVFFLIDLLFTGGPASAGRPDANGDGSTSVADVFYLIDFLFTGGPAPVCH